MLIGQIELAKGEDNLQIPACLVGKTPLSITLLLKYKCLRYIYFHTFWPFCSPPKVSPDLK